MTTVAFFPSLDQLEQNPYWPLLAQHLKTEGVDVLQSNPRTLNLRWLWQNRHRVQVVHLHYFQQNYAYEKDYARLRWVLRFGRNLLLARLLGYQLIWTMHNSEPSFGLTPKRVEKLAWLIVAQLAQHVIVHCDAGRKLLAKRFGRRRKVHTLALPNFKPAYPQETSQTAARQSLIIDEQTLLLLCFGQLRPNKGIENLLHAFNQVQRTDIQLLIVGGPGRDSDYVAQLQKLADLDERVIFRPKWIDSADVHRYFFAADVVVTAFERVLTSASVALALSFGKPVVAPAKGCLPELISADIGWLYSPEQPNVLSEIIETIAKPHLAPMQQAALHKAQKMNWQAFAEQTKQLYVFS